MWSYFGFEILILLSWIYEYFFLQAAINSFYGTYEKWNVNILRLDVYFNPLKMHSEYKYLSEVSIKVTRNC